MDMLAPRKFFEQRSSYVASGDDRYHMLPINQQLEAQTVDVIKRTLLHLPEGTAELGATRRKLDNFYSSYKQPGSVYLVLFDSLTGLVLGGVGIVPFAGLDRSEGIGEIRELAVDAPYRRLGFGLKLMQAALDTAVSLKYRRLYLETTEQMAHAQNLFSRFGFRPVSLQKQDKRNRKEPLIRQSGQPAFYVWALNEIKDGPEHLHK